MTDTEPATYACKTSGCEHTVQYVRTVIPGALKLTKRDTGQQRTRVVYLRCESGHVHPYAVQVTT